MGQDMKCDGQASIRVWDSAQVLLSTIAVPRVRREPVIARKRVYEKDCFCRVVFRSVVGVG
jgi:ethanolamine ammonia-lyase large subunit